MSSIPPGIYERVHELAVAIVNASGAGRHLCSSMSRRTPR
jgi:hypothetical protein